MQNWNTCDFNEINIVFAKKEEGKKLITQHDSYIENLTQQDLECRCHKLGATLEDYLKLCEEAVLDFSEEEIGQTTWLLCEINCELQRRGMVLPYLDQIYLVKVSGQEENGLLGYTRGNAIYMNQTIFEHECLQERFLVHELFHILTRHCLAFKKAMYSIVGFDVEEKSFKYPKTEEFYFVSNPDVSNQVCHASLKVHGRTYEAIVMTGSQERYDGGDFHQYFRPHFFPIDDDHEFLRNDQGELVIFSFKEGDSSYLKHVGHNTGYISNPEEVLADNFIIAVLGTLDDLPNPEIIDAIRGNCARKA